MQTTVFHRCRYLWYDCQVRSELMQTNGVDANVVDGDKTRIGEQETE